MRTSLLLTGLGCALAASPARSQDTIAPGFTQTGSQPVPVAFAAYHTLSSGERVVFDGTSIDLYDGANNFIMNLGTLPGFVFASFVEADPSETFALVGESSNGDLFKVALDGSGMSTLATLDFNYEAVFEDASHALVSAATCGFGCGNDVVRVDATSGATTFVASVPGSAGPLAMAPDGGLFYATVSDSFPPPPGSTDIVHWSAAQLASGLTLGLGDSTIFAGGLDGAASLAVDPAFGSVFLAESIFGATSRVLELAPDGDLVGAVVESAEFLANLELREGGGPGHFHAWQPADGVFLHYSNGDIVSVAPARPQATLAASGPFWNLDVTGAPPNGRMLVTFTGDAHVAPRESALELFPDFLYVTPFDPAETRRLQAWIPVDANGEATYAFAFAPGEHGPSLSYQALLADPTGAYAATSTVAP